MNPHYKLPNGDMISKASVDKAKALLARLNDGYELIELTDEELFSKGDRFDAVVRFRNKYDCTLTEANAAIKHLRGE